MRSICGGTRAKRCAAAHTYANAYAFAYVCCIRIRMRAYAYACAHITRYPREERLFFFLAAGLPLYEADRDKDRQRQRQRQRQAERREREKKKGRERVRESCVPMQQYACILLYMCPHTTIHVSSYSCPHNTDNSCCAPLRSSTTRLTCACVCVCVCLTYERMRMRQVLCGAEIFYDPLDMRVIDRHVKLLVYAALSY